MDSRDLACKVCQLVVYLRATVNSPDSIMRMAFYLHHHKRCSYAVAHVYFRNLPVRSLKKKERPHSNNPFKQAPAPIMRKKVPQHPVPSFVWRRQTTLVNRIQEQVRPVKRNPGPLPSSGLAAVARPCSGTCSDQTSSFRKRPPSQEPARTS